jgi:hypothetical protein
VHPEPLLTFSALYDMQVEVTPLSRRVCVPVWQRAKVPGQASGPPGE